MNRIKVLRIAYLFALVSAGCSSPLTEPSGNGGNSDGSGGSAVGSGGSGSGGTTQGLGGARTSGLGGAGAGGTAGTGGPGAGGTTGSTGGASSAGGRIGSLGGAPGAGGATGAGGAAPATQMVITSAPGAFWKTGGALTTSTGTPTVTVNDGTTMQTFEGFGGAFNEMGWNYLSMLSATDRDQAIKLLFDATAGAHFVMGRIPIGASDYALQRYTDDETANDTNLTGFSITEDNKYLIPYVHAAQAVNPNIRFWASPWTPPTWMKTNMGSVSGVSCARAGNTAYDGGCMQDIAANLTILAGYFVKWIQAYAALTPAINIEFLAPQNEPDYAQGYPSALWAPALYTKFIRQYLSPALTTANLSTKIMLGTMSNGDNGMMSLDLNVVTNVMADATAKGLVKVVGLQWGMLDIYKSNPSWLNIGSLPVWATEHKCGNYPWMTATYVEPAPNDQAYGNESWGYIRDAIKGGVTAYSAWNMVLNSSGKGNDTARQWSQDALLVAGTTTCHGTAISNQLCATPAYYAFRHVSQYVQAGAKVVATSGGDAIAFKNPDGSVVTAMYNSGGASTYVVQIKGQKLQFAMPGTAWATVVVP